MFTTHTYVHMMKHYPTPVYLIIESLYISQQGPSVPAATIFIFWCLCPLLSSFSFACLFLFFFRVLSLSLLLSLILFTCFLPPVDAFFHFYVLLLLFPTYTLLEHPFSPLPFSFFFFFSVTSTTRCFYPVAPSLPHFSYALLSLFLFVLLFSPFSLLHVLFSITYSLILLSILFPSAATPATLSLSSSFSLPTSLSFLLLLCPLLHALPRLLHCTPQHYCTQLSLRYSTCCMHTYCKTYILSPLYSSIHLYLFCTHSRVLLYTMHIHIYMSLFGFPSAAAWEWKREGSALVIQYEAQQFEHHIATESILQ